MANDINGQSDSSIYGNKFEIKNKFQFGLKAGGNLSNVYDTKGEAFDANPRYSLATGVFCVVPVTRFLYVQPEIILSPKSFTATGILLGRTYYFTRTTQYIDIPLFFAFKPNELITLLAGPQYSYLINQKDEFANATTSLVQQQEFKNDKIRKNILCVVGGVDITIRFLIFGVRAGWNVQNNNVDQTSATPRYKNVWGQCTFGCIF